MLAQIVRLVETAEQQGARAAGWQTSTAVMVDKTGTLTKGKPHITEVAAEGIAENELLRLAAAAETRSSHPLAQTVLHELVHRTLANDFVLHEFENIAGYGIRARVGGRQMLVGARRLLDRYNIKRGVLQVAADRLLSEGTLSQSR